MAKDKADKTTTESAKETSNKDTAKSVAVEETKSTPVVETTKTETPTTPETPKAETEPLLEEKIETKQAEQPQIDPEKIKQEVLAEVKKEQETQAKAQEDKINTILKDWYSEYNMLAKAGKATAIKDENDPNDPGVIARRKIIQGLGKLKQQGQSVSTLSQVLLLNPSVLTAPGADAPISGESGPQSNPDSFKNSELRNKSFLEIAQGD